jgi:hypothetical protein
VRVRLSDYYEVSSVGECDTRGARIRPLGTSGGPSTAAPASGKAASKPPEKRGDAKGQNDSKEFAEKVSGGEEENPKAAEEGSEEGCEQKIGGEDVMEVNGSGEGTEGGAEEPADAAIAVKEGVEEGSDLNVVAAES